MKFKEYIILYMYRIAFSWIVARLSQLNCPAVATLSQLCRNFAQLNCPAVATLRNSIAQLSQLCRNSVATLRNSIAQRLPSCRKITSICLSSNAQNHQPAETFLGQIEVIPTALFGDCTGRISTAGVIG